MKIWGQIPAVSGVYNKNKSSGKVESSSGASSRNDMVSISEQGKDFQTALKAAREAPDIRIDKVEKIKQQMQEDKYDVSGQEVAGKIVDELLNRKI